MPINGFTLLVYRLLAVKGQSLPFPNIKAALTSWCPRLHCLRLWRQGMEPQKDRRWRSAYGCRNIASHRKSAACARCAENCALFVCRLQRRCRPETTSHPWHQKTTLTIIKTHWKPGQFDCSKRFTSTLVAQHVCVQGLSAPAGVVGWRFFQFSMGWVGLGQICPKYRISIYVK